MRVSSFDASCRRFLARAYEYKDISDYRTDRAVTPVEDADVVERARAFVDAVRRALENAMR